MKQWVFGEQKPFGEPNGINQTNKEDALSYWAHTGPPTNLSLGDLFAGAKGEQTWKQKNKPHSSQKKPTGEHLAFSETSAITDNHQSLMNEWNQSIEMRKKFENIFSKNYFIEAHTSWWKSFASFSTLRILLPFEIVFTVLLDSLQCYTRRTCGRTLLRTGNATLKADTRECRMVLLAFCWSTNRQRSRNKQ